jgi:hypothetical protein
MATSPWGADELFKAFRLNDAERELVIQATNTTMPQGIARAQAISELVLAKSIQNAAERVIDSNEKLSRSNENYSARMIGLTRALVAATVALVLVGAVQIVVPIATSSHRTASRPAQRNRRRVKGQSPQHAQGFLRRTR